VGTFQPLEVPADLSQHRLDVEDEVRLHVGQLSRAFSSVFPALSASASESTTTTA
jgi:hypothetical protein